MHRRMSIVTALAMAILPEPGERAAGVINFAGPSARLSPERCKELVPVLRDAADELAALFRESSYAANAVREHGLSYSRFMEALKKANIVMDRKVLAHLAATDPDAFARLVQTAKEAA